MRLITGASLFVYNQHDKGGERERQEFQHLLHKNMPLLLFCLIQKLTTHSSLPTAHYSLLKNMSLLFFYITKNDTTELMVILNLFNVVQFAHARQSSSKHVSALA